ncbi:unnamed protein product [Coregonus sp. 'balchen']|nr:unnamed protein product [Coregonus sp. 'balchen']
MGTRMAREHKNIVHYKRYLEECETLGVPQTEQGRLDLELKIEDTKENIRKAEARNKRGLIGYVPEKYLQFPTSNSLLSMLQSLAALDARSHTSFVRALYDYAGQADEELSFPEGAVIRLLNRDTQTDDGFWEGESLHLRGCPPPCHPSLCMTSPPAAPTPPQTPPPLRPSLDHPLSTGNTSHLPQCTRDPLTVRAAPPPPKQKPRKKAEKTEEVEITLV